MNPAGLRDGARSWWRLLRRPAIGLDTGMEGVPALRGAEGMVWHLFARALAHSGYRAVRAPGRGAAPLLEVRLLDLACRAAGRLPENLGELRVHTTLVLSHAVHSAGSGRGSGGTIAICRRTEPIVPGTAVGAAALHGMLREGAHQVAARVAADPAVEGQARISRF